MSEYVFRLLKIWLALHGYILHFVLVSGTNPAALPFGLEKRPFYINSDEDLKLTPWIKDDIKLGQVSGVSIDPDDNVYLFHRADRVWDDRSFTKHEIYTQQQKGPITQPTILVFNNAGSLLSQLGSNMFFLPHGITIDSNYNIWVTDVALHQVIKLLPRSNNASLVLGEKFVPGKDSKHFCKPTSIAVLLNGDFFIADGYCNSRLLKFNSEGKLILEWGRETSSVHPPGQYELNVPHALTLVEDKGLICTADRENGRIICFKIDDGKYISHISSTIMGTRIFSVAYSNGRFFAVNGRDINGGVPVGGFVLTPSGKIIGHFGSNLNTPHDIAVSSNGSFVYVVEINPYKAWKYVIRSSNLDSVVMQEEDKQPSTSTYNESVDNVEGLTGAILVTFGCFVFAVGLLMAMLIYSKSKRNSSSDTRRLLSNIDY